MPTLTFRLLYCFFVIAHDRRKIQHFNVTAHPTAEWVCQQLREAFPDGSPYKYAILDRDTKFSAGVLDLLKASGIEPVRTSIRSPWQNGTAERWVGSARRECFDHVIAISEAHVRRLGREFVAYYHADRTHLGLDKDHFSNWSWATYRLGLPSANQARRLSGVRCQVFGSGLSRRR